MHVWQHDQTDQQIEHLAAAFAVKRLPPADLGLR